MEVERKKRLDAFLGNMKEAGISVLTEGVAHRAERVEVIPTGLCSFDLATGVGGLPRGRIVEFFGAEAAGKSMLALLASGNAQRMGGMAGFVDAEHSLTPDFARLLGVDYNKLVVAKPDDLEQAFDSTKKMIESDVFDIITFDSMAGIASREEIEADAAEGQSRASLARMASQELKKIVAVMSRSGKKVRCCVIFINQVREKPDAGGGKMDSKYTTGGRAIRHHASLRVEVKMQEPHLDNKRRIGHHAKITIKKNKVAAPFTEAEFDLYYKTGIDKVTDLIETAITAEVIERQSSFFVFEKHKWHGRETAEQNIRADSKMASRIYGLVMQKLQHERDGTSPQD